MDDEECELLQLLCQARDDIELLADIVEIRTGKEAHQQRKLIQRIETFLANRTSRTAEDLDVIG